MPAISIIIPIYNVAAYLPQCLRSVLDQSFDDFEAICIDDGSTDGSGELADLMAGADQRFTVVHKANGGVSSAKNAGLDIARGEHVCFLDSDDMMRPNALQRLHDAFRKTDADVVVHGGSPYPEHAGSVWLNEALTTRPAQFDGFSPRLMFRSNATPFAWRTACKRSFLDEHRLRYDETIPFGEDTVFQFAVYPRAARTVVIPDKLVDYRAVRDGSFMFQNRTQLLDRALVHAAEVGLIFTDWTELGIFHEYLDDLFAWSIGFMLPSLLLCAAGDDRAHIRKALAEVWQQHLSVTELATLRLNRRFRPVMQLVLDGTDIPPLRLRLALLRTFAHEHGLRYAINRMFENVGLRSLLLMARSPAQDRFS